MEENRIKTVTFFAAKIFGNQNPMLTKICVPFSVHQWIGITASDNDMSNF